VRCTLVYFMFGENAFKGERFMCKIRAWTVGFLTHFFFLSWPKKRHSESWKREKARVNNTIGA
jgi:hypothetical protein